MNTLRAAAILESRSPGITMAWPLRVLDWRERHELEDWLDLSAWWASAEPERATIVARSVFDLNRLMGWNWREPEPPIREVTLYKGTSVGCTTGILENVFAYLDDGVTHFGVLPVPRRPNVAEIAFATAEVEGGSRWSTKPSNPAEDIRATLEAIREPSYVPPPDLKALADLVRGPRQRPDLVVIDGIGYGNDDPLPPPFGSGT